MAHSYEPGLIAKARYAHDSPPLLPAADSKQASAAAHPKPNKLGLVLSTAAHADQRLAFHSRADGPTQQRPMRRRRPQKAICEGSRGANVSKATRAQSACASDLQRRMPRPQPDIYPSRHLSNCAMECVGVAAAASTDLRLGVLRGHALVRRHAQLPAGWNHVGTHTSARTRRHAHTRMQAAIPGTGAHASPVRRP